MIKGHSCSQDLTGKAKRLYTFCMIYNKNNRTKRLNKYCLSPLNWLRVELYDRAARINFKKIMKELD